MNESFLLQNYSLLPLFQKIHNRAEDFYCITFDRVHTNRNREVDRLSKAGLELDQGICKVTVKTQAVISKYFHNGYNNEQLFFSSCLYTLCYIAEVDCQTVELNRTLKVILCCVSRTLSAALKAGHFGNCSRYLFLF